MPRITLPDGSVKEYSAPVTAAAVARDIGAGLAKAALGAKIDGVLSDLSTTISKDAALSIVTAKKRDGSIDPDALFLLRHSAAHIMAEAIQRLFPKAQLVYGPPVEAGFYYDINFAGGDGPGAGAGGGGSNGSGARPMSSEDFSAVEAEMAKIVAEDRPFTRYEMPMAEGLAKLAGESNKYKVDNAERAREVGSSSLSWYATGTPGKNWDDLCRGPHVPSTGRVAAFKIMSLASSYWKGDEKSDRLTRVYGTAFESREALDAHLKLLDESKKRDHRVLGKQLRLFHIDEMVGQGLVLWTPAGAVVRQELQNFISEELRKQGYTQVFTPHIGKLGLYRTSGHFPYYRESQYQPIVEHETLSALAREGCTCAELMHRMESGEVDGYLLRPMNCPHHIRIFASAPHSYRDMPVRLSEFGTVYRWEQSGEVGGMTRVRGFTQDDAHLFCREDQIAHELMGCLSLVKLIFNTLGMTEYRVRVGLRDPNSDKYIGEDSAWQKSEEACRTAARTLGVEFSEEIGEAAFYGPKIDFVVKDVIGRSWQLGTVQVDYNLPARFGLSYIGADNQPHTPIMIHRAPFGSMERFIGCLIEHFAGAFPVWLAPEQVRVLPISEKSNAYAQELLAALNAAGLRATMDDSNERVQGKIRTASEMKIPYLAVVGPRDAESRQVSVRAFGTEANLGEVPFDTFVQAIVGEYRSRGKTTLKQTLGK